MRLHGGPFELSEGRTQQARISWLKVEADAPDWNRERSFGSGETREMARAIQYKRR